MQKFLEATGENRDAAVENALQVSSVWSATMYR